MRLVRVGAVYTQVSEEATIVKIVRANVPSNPYKQTREAQRWIRDARRHKRLVDLRSGRGPIRSLVRLSDGTLLVLSLDPRKVVASLAFQDVQSA